MSAVIGISGFAGSGKSLAASYLVSEFGFRIVSFATPLKNMLKQLGLSDEQLYGSKKGEPSRILNGKTPRYAMQTLGTEWGRDLIDKNLWVKLWCDQVDAYIALGHPVVCDDVRFISEVAGLRQMGGILWNIRRRSANPGEHESEKELPRELFDRIISNNGAESDLHHELNSIIRQKR